MDHLLGAHTFRNYRFEGMEQDGVFTVYRLKGSDGEGSGEVRCYPLLPGILMTYDRLDMKSCYQPVVPAEGYIQINHCTKGCYEFELEDGQVCFMGEGDLCVSNPWSQQFVSSRLPLEHYEGLAIILKVAAAQQSIRRFFPQVGMDLQALQTRIFAHEASYMIRAKPELDHMFTELYRVDERIRKDYCVLKILEIMLVLQLSLEEPQKQLPRFSQSVVTRTKEVYKYLIDVWSKR